jgi:hypothetical protein
MLVSPDWRDLECADGTLARCARRRCGLSACRLYIAWSLTGDVTAQDTDTERLTVLETQVAELVPANIYLELRVNELEQNALPPPESALPWDGFGRVEVSIDTFFGMYCRPSGQPIGSVAEQYSPLACFRVKPRRTTDGP